MNILLISPSIDPKRGGQERHVSNLAYFLKNNGNNVTIIVADKYKPKNFDINIVYINSFKILGLPIIDIKSYYAFCRNGNFDICHLHYETLFGEIILFINKLLKLPTIITLHSQIIRTLPMKFLLDQFSLIIINIFSDNIICLSLSLAYELRKRGLCMSKILIIPNAIKIPSLEEKMQTELSQNNSNNTDLLFVGRLEERKGIKILIKSMIYLKNKGKKINLKVVGRGPLDGEIKKMIRENDLSSSILMMGYISDNELIQCYSSTKSVVIPSYYEGVPGVALEALAYNKFLIGSDIPGLRELIFPNQNGFIVKPGDILSLADAIESSLENKIDKINNIELNKKIIKNFNWENIVNKIEFAYKKVLEKKRSIIL